MAPSTSTFSCSVGECSEVFPNASPASRKEHLTSCHGYPTCGVCFKVLKNVRLFEQHINEPHAVTPCGICKADVVVGTEKNHARDVHGFPECTICHQKFEPWYNFMKHVSTHTTTTCSFPGCEDPVITGLEVQHAAEKHGFPNCPHCSETFGRWDKFYIHVSGHAATTCQFLGCEDPVITGLEAQHAIEKHGFPNCPFCSETFGRWDNFYRHLSGHATTTCQFPGCEDPVITGLEVHHAIEKHGFPNCPHCSETFERWDNFYRHLSGHAATTCQCHGCEDPVITGLEVQHAREIHGFPTCPHCSETFERWDNFYRHVSGHTMDPCNYPGCQHTVVSGTAADHALAFHGFPVCPRCSDVVSGNYENFYTHVRAQSCEPPELRPCPYPNCRGNVYTNRTELTMEHLVEKHSGKNCDKCGLQNDTYMSVAIFIKHIEKCYNTRAPVSCDFCGLKFPTRGKLNSHLCVPTENALTADEAMVQIGSGLRPYPFLVQVSGMFTKEPFHFCVQFYKSTLRAPHHRHMTRVQELCLKRPNFSSDPTIAEIVSICDGPILLYLAPHEFSLTDKIKFAYRMMQEPPWVVWCLLVDRVASMSVDRWAGDIHFLRNLLKRMRLPDFIDPRFRDLDVIRAHVNLIAMRSDMDDITMTYTTQSGAQHDFGKLSKLLDKAHKRKNSPLIPEAILPLALPDPHTEAIDARFPVVSASRAEIHWEQVLSCFARNILLPVVDSKLFPLLESVTAVHKNFFGSNLFLADKFAEEVRRQRAEELDYWDNHMFYGFTSEQRLQRESELMQARLFIEQRTNFVELNWPQTEGLHSAEQELKARETQHMVTEMIHDANATAQPVSVASLPLSLTGPETCVHPRRRRATSKTVSLSSQLLANSNFIADLPGGRKRRKIMSRGGVGSVASVAVQ